MTLSFCPFSHSVYLPSCPVVCGLLSLFVYEKGSCSFFFFSVVFSHAAYANCKMKERKGRRERKKVKIENANYDQNEKRRRK
ncbi:MAG: hypothetical protein JOS17DRAFT_740202 [Linnemannia elongata]|nr:MAG: hypothetical protein JOS17DRAFT_740202 [Linnemannia elongata]